MEIWRMVATALTIVIGILLIMDAVSKIRGGAETRRPQRLRTAVKGTVLLVISTLLVATVLPATVVWALIGAAVLIMSIRFVVD